MSNEEKKINRTEAEWQNLLTSDQFQVCRLKATEPPFTGEYNHPKSPASIAAFVAVRHYLMLKRNTNLTQVGQVFTNP